MCSSDLVSQISLGELFTSIEGSAQTMTAQAQQTLTFSGFDKNVSITGNLTALQGALLNLVHNASQVTPKGECVHVETAVSDKRLHVAIIDKGPGVPDKLKNKIFEPFFTTKSATKGTGLGLAIVQQVLERHGGVLRIDTTPNKGSLFCCCFQGYSDQV